MFPGSLRFHLSPSGFSYLGVNITHCLATLHKTNFASLVTLVKADLQRWDSLPLSLAVRIQSVKMNISLGFYTLFSVFRSFFNFFFTKLDRLISHFIWDLGYVEQYFKEGDKMKDWHFQMYCFTIGQPILKRLRYGAH